MANVVRASKVRHVYGTASKKAECYEDLRIAMHSTTEGSLATVNGRFLAVAWDASGGGSFAVLPLSRTGRCGGVELPLYVGHTGPVLDLAFSPFHEDVLASASEDASIMVWHVPDPSASCRPATEPSKTLQGHRRKVTALAWHPTAEHVLASISTDLSVRLWDVAVGRQRLAIEDAHPDTIYALAFSWDGSLLATTCKDKQVRLFDARSGQLQASAAAHQGIKATQLVWLGPSRFFLTTGFSRLSERQLMLWDIDDLTGPCLIETLDSASGVLLPFFDPDTRMLYVAGRGDGNVRYFEVLLDQSKPAIVPLGDYKSVEPQRGVCFMPKRHLALGDTEVARMYKVGRASIEPVSFRVPRKSDAFQADLYPLTLAGRPALSCDDFFAGKTAQPVLMDLAEGRVIQAHDPIKQEDRAKTARPLNASSSLDSPLNGNAVLAAVDVDVKAAPVDDLHKQLLDCIADLKHQLAQRDSKIQALQLQLENTRKP